MGMVEYTKWYGKYPWHVTGTKESGKIPPNCDCGYCKAKLPEAGLLARPTLTNLPEESYRESNRL